MTEPIREPQVSKPTPLRKFLRSKAFAVIIGAILTGLAATFVPQLSQDDLRELTEITVDTAVELEQALGD